MRLSTTHNHLRRLSNKLAYVYSSAVYDHPSHKELCALVSSEVWEDPTFARLPYWARSVLYDRRSRLSDQIYSHLVWSFIGSDGVPRELHALTEDDRQAVFVDKIKGAHYWTRTAHQKLTMEDGTIVETIQRTITTKAY
jgi:hypothetical protein